MNYALENDQEYDAAAAEIDSIRRIDDATNALTWGLAIDPYTYKTIAEGSDLRFAWTKRHELTDGVIPRLRVLYTIDDVRKVVNLHMISVDETQTYEES